MHRLFLKVQDGVTWTDVVQAIDKAGLGFSGKTNSRAEFAIAYPHNSEVFQGWLYASSNYNDYAFKTLESFIAAAVEDAPLRHGGLGRAYWPKPGEWPHLVSYGPSKPPINKKTMSMNRPELYTVAAIWRPEYPAGTVVDRGEVDYPQVILEPTNVLARSENEALTKAAQHEAVKLYVEDQKGEIDWKIKKTF